MYGFDETQVPPHAQPYRGDSGPVGWAVWEAHRPTGTGGALTVQAAPDWSAEHLEEDAQSVAEAMLSAYLVIAGLAPGEPRYIAAHRWRYARVIRPAPADASLVSQQETSPLPVTGSKGTGRRRLPVRTQRHGYASGVSHLGGN